MLKRLLGCLIMPIWAVGMLAWTTICLPIMLYFAISVAIEDFIEDKSFLGFLLIVPMWLGTIGARLNDEFETLKKVALYFFKDEEINFDDISE